MRAQIAVALVERDGCYLVGRRPEGLPLAGLWEFPGGKVKAAETPEEAAVRECQEEAEIAIRVRRLYDVVDYDYEHAALRLYFFACEVIGPAWEPKPPFQWLAAAELAGLKFPPANEAILRRFQLGI
ncbi:MAG TPA: (deoxy)nucleoside triphosphate pyrophosphohydrolase [Pirellulales bacterium]